MGGMAYLLDHLFLGYKLHDLIGVRNTDCFLFYVNNSFDRISILLKIFFPCYLGLCVQQNKVESFHHMQEERSCKFPCVQTSFSQKLFGYQECVSVKYITEIKLAVIIAVNSNLSNCL